MLDITTEKILDTEYLFLNADTDMFMVVCPDGSIEIVSIEVV